MSDVMPLDAKTKLAISRAELLAAMGYEQAGKKSARWILLLAHWSLLRRPVELLRLPH